MKNMGQVIELALYSYGMPFFFGGGLGLAIPIELKTNNSVKQTVAFSGDTMFASNAYLLPNPLMDRSPKTIAFNLLEMQFP